MDRPPVSILPKGRQFARAVIAKIAAGSVESGAAFALERWGPVADWECVVRSVTPIAVSDIQGDAVQMATAEFFALVAQASIVGRLAGRREVPLRTRLIAQNGAATAFWVSQKAPKPLSRTSLAGATMEPRKIAGILVMTAEGLRAATPKGEALFQNELLRVVTDMLDQTFIDAANAGVADESPASITNGVTPISGSGNPATDLAALVADFTGDLSSAYFVTDPLTATELALARDAGGSFMFPDCGPRGGTLINIPLLTSRSSPRDSSGGQIVLVDASAIATAIEGLAVDSAAQATLQMSDDPDDPQDASTALVSLWQHDLVALRAEIYANWNTEREGAVAVVTGATYATEAA